jgi:hypothetical protein
LQIVEREALESLVAVARHRHASSGRHVVRIAAEIGNEPAVPA